MATTVARRMPLARLALRCRAVWMESRGSEPPSSSTKNGNGKDDFTPGFYDNLIQKYAAHEEEHNEVVNLKKLMKIGNAAQVDERHSVVWENARFLQKELPKRLARRLLDLQFLPYIVVINPNIKKVYNSYYNAFQTLRKFPEVKDDESNADFTVLLKRLVDEHGPMVEALAAGLRECKSKPFIGDQLKLDSFLNSMLTSRISRRILAEQHVALQQKRQNFVGIVCTQLDLHEAVDFAYRKAQQACVETYGTSPEVRVIGDQGEDAIISYIPAHLDYMLFELMKNALRATVENSILSGGGKGSRRKKMPSVTVKICKGRCAVTIKISDQGGGIDSVDERKVWNYGYTTVDENAGLEIDQGLDQGGALDLSGAAAGSNSHSKMAGLGFGLPLSRLHARYFGGDLEIVNVNGYGVDVYLNLRNLRDKDIEIA
ncbi:pyruvate dehydrogenase kinase [Chloropicon primus]|uniref:Protein-serine/threonine kinase n=1 Tax=Chloropicon primus TaxID=1764295 RepID=A0A5B8MSX5_9CHLO|nr:pyruvate dehydrogenase kinase [Chloropicon primus]UPR01949.1 pyruvate dehydrogenase kinase [Chloropicon primus]|mmetsp:Transcript_9948/g.28271  ORF Transcript_9948/g.28271 Transcript_9948/m.28271 type:complete len:430 (+) Transcript_9948:585-1874(+)|eukprot:QDZ22725.1 pyruvate dehydrogenase kinase [Chloropicon primus]